MKKITKNWKIEELIEKYPESVDLLVDYGFHCIGCSLASFETIEQGGKAHGLKDKEIEALIKKLNNLSSDSRKEEKS